MVKFEVFCPNSYLEKFLNFLNAIPGKAFRMKGCHMYMTGEELKEIREELNMSQEEFGDVVSATSQQAISQMETGARKVSKVVAEAAIKTRGDHRAKRKT